MLNKIITRIVLSNIFVIYAIFILSAFQVLYKPCGYIILLLYVGFIIPVFLQVKIKKIFFRIKELNFLEKFLISAALVFFIISFISLFIPLDGMDVLTARMNTPKRYLINHGFLSLPHSLASNLPMSTEMLFLFGLTIGSDIISRFFVWVIAILLYLLIIDISKYYFDLKTGVVAASIILCTQTFNAQSFIPLIDLNLALFILLSIRHLLLYFEKKELKSLVLFSIFSGVSISIKFNGIIFIAFLVILLIYNSIKNKNPQFKYVFMCAIIIFMFIVPWNIKSYLFTNNPIYPYFSDLFNLNPPYNALKEFNPYAINLNNICIKQKILDFFLYPWDISNGIITVTSFPKQYGIIGPLIGILFVVALIKKFYLRKLLLLFFALALINYTIHFLALLYLGPLPRYIFISFILLSIIGSWAFHNLENKLLKKTLTILIICWSIFFISFSSYKKTKKWSYIFNKETISEYYEKDGNFKYYKDFTYLNKIVKKNEKVLIFDPRAYFLDTDYILARYTYYIWKYEKINSAEDIGQWLKKNNVRYLCFDKDLMKLQPYDRILIKKIKDFIAYRNLSPISLNAELNTHIYKLY